MTDSGISIGLSGNLSVRCEQGFLITPSGMEYDRLIPADIVLMDLDGKAGGNRKPSSEWRFHRDIYRHRADAGAIVHAHPVHCTALACARQGIPAFHYMVSVAGGKNIRCAGYATFGTQALSDNILLAIKDRTACLMANHGLLCLAADLPAALSMAIEIEHLAHTYNLCRASGDVTLLDDEEMKRVLKKFENYGDRAQEGQ